MNKFIIGAICIGAGYLIGGFHMVLMCSTVLYEAAEGNSRARDIVLDMDHLGEMRSNH